MEDQKVVENHLTSAAAFVEGGIQDACDDACSICLEPFCDSDPSTVTNCKHEFHLQCILEWCQRSSQCPMCWQSISLKDPSSQELLDAVEHERNIRMNPPRNRTIFHHPTLGDFELQHLPVNASESELEERIIQHLAAAAAMGRARHVSRRGGHRNRSSSAAQGRPQFLVFSTNPSDSSSQALGDSSNTVVSDVGSSPPEVGEDSPQIITRPPSYDVQFQTDQIVTNVSGSSAGASSNRAPSETSPNNQDRAGPSDFHSFSENFKSRLNALSTRYKDSIAKSTRSWKEKFFNRSSSSPEPTSDVNREPNQSANTGHNSVNASTGQIIGEVSRMMDHLNIAEDDRIRTINASSPLSTTEDGEIPNPSETERENLSSEDGARVPCSAGSTSS